MKEMMRQDSMMKLREKRKLEELSNMANTIDKNVSLQDYLNKRNKEKSAFSFVKFIDKKEESNNSITNARKNSSLLKDIYFFHRINQNDEESIPSDSRRESIIKNKNTLNKADTFNKTFKVMSKHHLFSNTQNTLNTKDKDTTQFNFEEDTVESREFINRNNSKIKDYNNNVNNNIVTLKQINNKNIFNKSSNSKYYNNQLINNRNNFRNMNKNSTYTKLNINNKTVREEQHKNTCEYFKQLISLETEVKVLNKKNSELSYMNYTLHNQIMSKSNMIISYIHLTKELNNRIDQLKIDKENYIISNFIYNKDINNYKTINSKFIEKEEKILDKNYNNNNNIASKYDNHDKSNMKNIPKLKLSLLNDNKQTFDSQNMEINDKLDNELKRDSSSTSKNFFPNQSFRLNIKEAQEHKMSSRKYKSINPTNYFNIRNNKNNVKNNKQLLNSNNYGKKYNNLNLLEVILNNSKTNQTKKSNSRSPIKNAKNRFIIKQNTDNSKFSNNYNSNYNTSNLFPERTQLKQIKEKINTRRLSLVKNNISNMYKIEKIKLLPKSKSCFITHINIAKLLQEIEEKIKFNKSRNLNVKKTFNKLQTINSYISKTCLHKSNEKRELINEIYSSNKINEASIHSNFNNNKNYTSKNPGSLSIKKSKFAEKYDLFSNNKINNFDCVHNKSFINNLSSNKYIHKSLFNSRDTKSTYNNFNQNNKKDDINQVDCNRNHEINDDIYSLRSRKQNFTYSESSSSNNNQSYNGKTNNNNNFNFILKNKSNKHYQNIETKASVFQTRKYKYNDSSNGSLLYLSREALFKLLKTNEVYTILKNLNKNDSSIANYLKSASVLEINAFSNSLISLVDQCKSAFTSLSLIKELIHSATILYNEVDLNKNFLNCLNLANKIFQTRKSIIYLKEYNTVRNCITYSISIEQLRSDTNNSNNINNQHIKKQEFMIENSIVDQVTNKNKIIIINNISSSTEFSQDDWSIVSGEKNTIYCPIKSSKDSSNIIGAIQLISKHSNKFNSDDEVILGKFSDIFSSILDNNIAYSNKIELIKKHSLLSELSNELSQLFNDYHSSIHHYYKQAEYYYSMTVIIEKYIKMLFDGSCSQFYYCVDENRFCKTHYKAIKKDFFTCEGSDETFIKRNTISLYNINKNDDKNNKNKVVNSYHYGVNSKDNKEAINNSFNSGDLKDEDIINAQLYKTYYNNILINKNLLSSIDHVSLKSKDTKENNNTKGNKDIIMAKKATFNNNPLLPIKDDHLNIKSSNNIRKSMKNVNEDFINNLKEKKEDSDYKLWYYGKYKLITNPITINSLVGNCYRKDENSIILNINNSGEFNSKLDLQTPYDSVCTFNLKNKEGVIIGIAQVSYYMKQYSDPIDLYNKKKLSEEEKSLVRDLSKIISNYMNY